MTALDSHAILTEEQIALIVERVLAVLAEKQRVGIQKIREAKIADLRAFEDMHDQPRSILSWKERQGKDVQMPAPSTPIREALDYLLDARVIMRSEHNVLVRLPSTVRTLEDLRQLVKRGVLPDKHVTRTLQRLFE